MTATTARTPCLRTRPLEPDDRPAMRAVFEGMSAESRYLRFAAPKPRVTEREVRHLLAVDHHDHEALLALDCATGRPVAVARYVRLPGEPDVADVALTVVDDHQGRGVGTRLFEQLAERAAAEGVRTLRADTLQENRRAIRLLRRLGFAPVAHEGGLATFERVPG